MAGDGSHQVDELTRLREEFEARLAEEQRRRQEAESQRDEERRRRQEAESQREEERRQREEAQRQREEAQRQREEEHRQRIQEKQDMATVVAALQEERAAKLRDDSQQQLSGYLADVDSLNYVMSRLLPPPRNAVKTLSEGVAARPTTSGRTTITKKYYPLKMRVWPEFLQTCRTAFARIQDLLGEQALFPSKTTMRVMEAALVRRLPTLFLGSQSFINEMRTSYFLNESLQIPAENIINAYNHACGREQHLLFDNKSTGWMSRSRHDDDDGTQDAAVAAAAPVAMATVEVPRKIQPDCLVLCAHVVPAVHRLRAPVVAAYAEHPLPEDFMLELAKRGGSSKGKAVSDSNNANPDAYLNDVAAKMQCKPGQVYYARALCQTFHYMVTSGLEYGYLASGETLTLMRVAPDDPTTLLYCPTLYPKYVRDRTADADEEEGDTEANVGDDDDDDDLAIAALAGLCLLAFESSTEPLRQRSFNLSKLALFPALPPSEQGRASAATTRSSSLQSRNSSRNSSRDSSRGRRRPREDDGDGDGDGDDDDNGGGGSSSRRGGHLTVPAHRPRRSSPLKRQRTASTDEADESGSVLHLHSNKRQRIDILQRGQRSLTPSLPSPFDPSSFRPIRPYCTQACLRSLVLGEAMDHDCPNIVLHLRASSGECSSGPTRPRQRPTTQQHAITVAELHALVQAQLLGNMEQDCECLLGQGQWGAVGCLFKITVTGFGYTLVAKGVQSFDSALLRREVGVYARLADHQGFLVPVCLGLLRLHQPYPMDNCMLVTHMMLMSYAGLPLYSPRLRNDPAVRYVNLEHEARRTIAELYVAGLVDEDDESEANMTWCAERRRVMRIDFDQATMRPRETDADADAKDANKDHVSQGWLRQLRQLRRSHLHAVAPSGHSQDDSGAWWPARAYSGHSAVESLLLV